MHLPIPTISLFTLFFIFSACSGNKTDKDKNIKANQKNNLKIKTAKDKDGNIKKTTASKDIADKDSTGKKLIVTQSVFKADENGKYTIPDAAQMLILTPGKTSWSVEKITDRESNVFHKALPYENEGILTLGANEALLKSWKKTNGKWQSTTIWNPTFGGKHNRLRDFEIADFNGDSMDDLVIATHDQGVIAILWRKKNGWRPQELVRQKDTFVHEIEIGDLDGDKNMEIYATPSQPNTLSGKRQGGKIVVFKSVNGKFEQSEVVAYENRHVKEILVFDVDKDGKSELYAALEAVMNGSDMVTPVAIKRFDLIDGKYQSSQIATIDDRFLRFLVSGDIDKDGENELIASAFSSGVWVIKKINGKYEKNCIDSDSGGFEHAAYITDIENDGENELYIADDRSGLLVRYDFKNGKYEKKIISRRIVPNQAMVWNITETLIK